MRIVEILGMENQPDPNQLELNPQVINPLQPTRITQPQPVQQSTPVITPFDKVRKIDMNTTDAELDQLFPKAGEIVDSRTVREDIPNLPSIGSSLTNYEALSGVREVAMNLFDDFATHDTPNDRYIKELAQQIKYSQEINPLIVVVDEKGLYILEGGHRYSALHILKAKSFPALVVLDIESLPEGQDQD